MLLTLTSTTAPATDLGYLLHKNPSRAVVFDLTFGRAHVFYPEAEPDRCTAALLVDVDSIGLVRGRRGPSGEGRVLERMPEKKRERIKLFQGSLMYRDRRLSGHDAAAVVEVIEHLDPPRARE